MSASGGGGGGCNITVLPKGHLNLPRVEPSSVFHDLASLSFLSRAAVAF